MAVEIKATNTENSCSVCGRTLLKGESSETYVTSGGESKEVCDLCRERVEHQGWVRSDGTDRPLMPKIRKKKGGGPFSSLRRGSKRKGKGEQEEKETPREVAAFESGTAKDVFDVEEESSTFEPDVTDDNEEHAKRAKDKGRSGIYAVPTSDPGKLERAAELFNKTEHTGTVTGVARTLGKPKVAVQVADGSSADVYIVVAWELSWYRYVVDVSKKDGAVRLHDKGDELDEIPEPLRSWNADVDENGSIALLVEE